MCPTHVGSCQFASTMITNALYCVAVLCIKLQDEVKQPPPSSWQVRPHKRKASSLADVDNVDTVEPKTSSDTVTASVHAAAHSSTSIPVPTNATVAAYSSSLSGGIQTRSTLSSQPCPPVSVPGASLVTAACADEGKT